jgi:hypothetical protein
MQYNETEASKGQEFNDHPTQTNPRANFPSIEIPAKDLSGT